MARKLFLADIVVGRWYLHWPSEQVLRVDWIRPSGVIIARDASGLCAAVCPEFLREVA